METMASPEPMKVEFKMDEKTRERMEKVKKKLGVRYGADVLHMAFNHFADHVERGEVFWDLGGENQK